VTQQDEHPLKRDPKPRNRRRRGGVWLRAAVLICLMPLAFALAAGVMIIDREITAPSWIVTRIESRAAELLEGGALRFGAITLRIGRDLHPTVRLVDTQLYDESGLTIARVPQVEGLISPRGLILQQDVLIQDIRLTGAQINLRRARDGSIGVAFGAGTGEVRRAGSLAELLDQSDQLFERPALIALETVRADGLIVNFDDARAGRSWIVDGGTLALDLRGGQTVLRGDLALLSGRAGVTTVSLSYSSPRGSRAAQLGLNISDAAASDIAAQSPALTWLRDIDAPMTAAMRTSLDADGALGPLSAVLEIGQGVLQPNPATAPVRFDAAKAYLTYHPTRDQIVFDQITLETEWGQLKASGQAYLREFRDGLPRALLAQFQFRDLVVNPAGLYEAPLAVPAVAIDLRLRLDPFRIEVGQLVINDGPVMAMARGNVAATAAGWQVAMDVTADEITPAKLIAYWPPTLKPRTRTWFVNNLAQGRIFNVAAGLRLRPTVVPHFAAGFEFAGAEVKFLRHLPPITDGYGAVSFIDSSVVVSLDTGHVAAPEGGQVNLAGSVFSIPNMRVPNAPAVLDLRVASSVTAMLSVLNQPPFEFLNKANLPVAIADGRAVAAGRITLPLKPRLTNAEVDFDMTADLSGVRSAVLIPGRTLSAPALTVRADRSGLQIGGPIRVGDVPVNGMWTQQFGPEFKGRSQVQATIELSPRFLDAFGIALPPGTITGAGQGQLTIDLLRGAPPAFTLASDLRGLRVALPPIGWAKAADTAGELRVAGTLGAVPRIETLVINGGGLQAQGRIDLTDGGTLAAARFERVRIGNWFDAPITIVGRGRGQPVGVEIAGGTLDLRRASFGAGQGEGGPMQIALDRLQITEGIALTGFRGDFNGAGGFSGQFDARVNGAVAVQGAVAPRDGRSAVRLRSDDAGGVLLAAGFMRNAVGGTLDLTLLPAGDAGAFDGALALRGLRVRDAPAIAALLDAISVVGLLQQMDGKGLAFDEVDARFRLSPTQVIVTQASAVGPGLGISVDGIYTLASKQIDLQGVVSPFYLLNSVGSFLTRKGEGLIGFNFNIGGTADAPQVSVNPLSALTPGMFREIFRRPPPELDQ